MLTTLLAHLGASAVATVGVLLVVAARTPPGFGRRALSPALWTGYATGHFLMRGRGWPTDAVDWVPYLALGPAVAGAVATRVGSRRYGLVSLGRLLWSSVSSGVLLGMVAGASGRGGLASLLVTPGVWFVSWGIASNLARRRESGCGSVLAVVAVGTAAVSQLSASFTLFSLALAVAVSLAGATCVRPWLGGPAWERGAVGVPVTALAGLLTVGVFYGEVPAACALLLAFAPAACLVEKLPAVGRLRAGWRRAAGLAAAVAVVVAAVGLAAFRAPEALL